MVRPRATDLKAASAARRSESVTSRWRSFAPRFPSRHATLIPNPHLLIGPHLRLGAVLSSRIEGTKTDVPQLLRFEAGQVARSGDADDAREVANYVVAMEHGLARLQEGFPLSVRLLREMHERLLAGVRGQYRSPGDLRASPNWIGGTSLENAVFVPPPPDALGEVIVRLGTVPSRARAAPASSAGPRPLPVRGHPSVPGRQRPDRTVDHPADACRAGSADPASPLPVGVLRAAPERVLRPSAGTSQRGDLEPWLAFFLRGVRRQARDAEERTVRLVDLQHALRGELLGEGRPNSVVRLADQLFATPIVTALRVGAALGVSRPTAQAAIDTLVERGDLVEVTGR